MKDHGSLSSHLGKTGFQLTSMVDLIEERVMTGPLLTAVFLKTVSYSKCNLQTDNNSITLLDMQLLFGNVDS